MNRRTFLLAAAASLPAIARARAQSGRIYRVGLLASGTLSFGDERMQAFAKGLASRGYVENKNLVLDTRMSQAATDRLPGMAKELIDAHVDLIVTFGYPAALAAKKVTTTVPVVVTGSGDPVATGLVEGLAHPGGNLTGMTEMSTELSEKRLELLKEAVPGLRRVAMIWNSADLGMTLRYRAAENAARVLGFEVQTLGVREPNDFDDAFGAMSTTQPDGILMVSDALTMLNRKRVLEFAG